MSTRTCYWFLFSMDDLFHASISNAIECFAIAVILWDAHPNLLFFSEMASLIFHTLLWHNRRYEFDCYQIKCIKMISKLA